MSAAPLLRVVPFDDLAALGEIVERGFDDWGQPVVIDEATLAAFARITGTSTDGRHIPGAMLQAYLPKFDPPRSWAIGGHAGAINLGSPATRYPAPAEIGASLRARCRLASAKASPKGTLVTLEFQVRADGAAADCLTAFVELLYMGGRA